MGRPLPKTRPPYPPQFRAPQGMGLGHPLDECAHLRRDSWAAGSGPPALPGPEQPEAGAVPANDGLGLDDGNGLRPAVPQARKPDPEEAVARSQAWARRGPPEDGQLVAQGEVLEHQGVVGPDPAEEAGEDENDHGSQHRSGRPEGQS